MGSQEPGMQLLHSSLLVEELSIEKKLLVAFPLIEGLYQQLDADKSGNVYFETVLFQLRYVISGTAFAF